MPTLRLFISIYYPTSSDMSNKEHITYKTSSFSLRSIIILLMLTVTTSVNASDIKTYWTNIPDSICLLHDQAVITDSTDTYIKAEITKALTIEAKTLKTAENDTLICLIKTYSAPAKESTVVLYNTRWEKMEDIVLSLENHFPDATSKKEYFFPTLISATLNKTSNELILRLSPINISDDEKRDIKDIKMQKILKWNGKTFK